MQEDNSFNPSQQDEASNDSSSNDQAPPAQNDTVLIEWTASEYIAHHKPASWYVLLGSIVAVISIAVYLLTQDVVSTSVVVIAGVLFGVFALRKPEVRTYQLKTSGLTISNKHFPFDLFKSFAVHEEQALRSIFLMPMKRFMPGLTLYFPPDQEEKIVNALSDYLPLEDREPDAIDKLMNKIRF